MPTESTFETSTPQIVVNTQDEPLAHGPFEPTWESLLQYETPEWFRDAKFGLWAHWGPQCQPEAGDWYARHMYYPGQAQFEQHREKYGDPAQFGFKDVIHEWKAEAWNPEALIALYKRAGARYFFAMANHHDNFDLWNSRYQPWNSTNMGPQRDIIGEWARAAKKAGLPLGLSIHSAHAWSWLEPSQNYDGRLTKADGAGQWWEGYDPQELYAQNHERSADSDNPNAIHEQWAWGNGASVPDAAYCENFFNRTLDLINQHAPELLYFDDTVLPLYPISDAGLKIAAHFYNSNLERHGELKAVLFGKILDETQRQTMVWDIERGVSDRIEPLPWQACTCIGNWHYNRAVYDENRYKSAQTVLQMLADVVSKNGNLLLSVPLRGNGTLDEKEVAIVEEIAAWMEIHGECIFGTRPWKVFGEGPASESAAPLRAQGFNEGQGKAFTAQDIRFTTKGSALYAIVLGQPTQSLAIKSLGTAARLLDTAIERVEKLGSDETVRWNQGEGALSIEAGQSQISSGPVAFKITIR